MHSPCQVHPLIAQIWRTRLPAYLVMAVNTGYLPGRVNFSARAGKETNVLAFLRDHAPPDAGDAYGHGHDQASGGSLSYVAWNTFARGLGFGPEMQVDVPHTGQTPRER
jgi:single-stranded-DNA-specific exonuclease